MSWETSPERERIIASRDFQGDGFRVIVAFDAPDFLLKHPDARTEMGRLGNAKGGYDPVVNFVFIRGCKTCQRLLSKCKCSTPVVGEIWAYDREIGINQALIDSLHKKQAEAKDPPPTKHNKIREQDILTLLTDLEGAFTDESGIRRTRNVFKPVNTGLLKHLIDPAVQLNMRFSYPQSYLERVQKVWNDYGRRLDIRPISNPDTERFGPSAKIQFRCPKDISILEDYPEGYKSAQRCLENGPVTPAGLLGMVVFYDVRLALQLFIDHGFNLEGSPWDLRTEK